jgi:hypothetical protein
MYATSEENYFPRTAKETTNWVISLNRPPLPECPIQAATDGKEPKAPHFIDGKIIKSVQWKHWQYNMPPQETIDKWFRDSRMGIGTLGGFNGKHWLCWVDFDAKDFESQSDCDRKVAEFETKYPLTQQMPKFRTPGGGYRYLVALEVEPDNFKANSAFSLSEDGSRHCGELLLKNGAHTLLPPTIGLNGKPYVWERWFEYPPVVEKPEDIGLFLYKKQNKENSPAAAPANYQSNSNDDTSISDFLINEVYPRLTLEQCFNDPCHDFKEYDGGLKLKGNCPWHDSNSGTAFYCRFDNGIPCYECPVDGKGNVIQYRHRLTHGAGAASPRGKDFIDIVKQLALEAGVLDKFPSNTNSNAKSNKTPSVKTPSSGGDSSSIIELSLRDRLIEILLRNSSVSEHKDALFKLSQSLKRPLRELEDLAQIIRAELEIEEDRNDTQRELQQLISIKNAKLELGDYFHKNLAEPLSELAYWMGVPAEVFLAPLLSTSASLLSSSMRIEANKATNFYQPFIFYMGLVCETGSKKSPILNVFVKSLSKLQEEEEKSYQIKKAAYDKEYKQWKNSKDEDKGEPPLPPTVREYYVKNATHEALNEIRGTQQTGFVYCLDELSGLMGSYGAYKGGRGTDKESVLSGYDGNGSKQNRAGGKRFFNPYDAMSILGATQPGKLAQQMGNMEDCQGEWARFLWIFYQEVVQRLPDDDDNTININGIIDGIFSRLLAISEAMPNEVFTFEKPGKILFNDYVYELDVKRLQEPRPGMKGAIAKLKGVAARLAGILYLLDCAASGNIPDKVIPTKFIELGIKLSRYFWGQIETIYSFSGVSNTEIAPVLAKIIELAQQQGDGRISNRVVCKKLKLKKEANLTNFRELEKMGYGTIEYKKQGFDFILNQVSPSVSSVPTSVPNVGDTRKPSDSNTFNPKISPVSPVSPVSPTNTTFDSNDDEPATKGGADIRNDIKEVGDTRDTRDTGDTRSETQHLQGFEQCPQVGDTSKNVGDTRDTADSSADTTAGKWYQNPSTGEEIYFNSQPESNWIEVAAPFDGDGNWLQNDEEDGISDPIDGF